MIEEARALDSRLHDLIAASCGNAVPGQRAGPAEDPVPGLPRRDLHPRPDPHRLGPLRGRGRASTWPSSRRCWPAIARPPAGRCPATSSPRVEHWGRAPARRRPIDAGRATAHRRSQREDTDESPATRVKAHEPRSVEAARSDATRRPAVLAPGCSASSALALGAPAPARARVGPGRVQPRHPADPLRELLPLPRARQEPPQGRPPARHPRRGPGQGGDRPRQARGERAGRPDPQRRRPDEVMPPPKSTKTLTAAQKDLLRRWVAEGAEYQPHWAYVPIRSGPPCPPVKRRGWVRNPIDAFILETLEAKKLAPSPEADRRTLLRRLSLDLIGLPPTPEEVRRLRRRRRPAGLRDGRSTGSSPRPTTASGWPSPGSTSSGSPTRSAITATRTSGSSPIATTSSTPSTATSRSTGSRSSSSPATSCPTRRPSSSSPPASTA